MTTENTEDFTQMPIESSPSNQNISEEDLLNTGFGGSITMKNKVFPVYCVKDFSIEDSEGKFVSLMEEGSSRTVLPKKLVLKGSIVSPFVTKVSNEVSPLMQGNDVAESSTRKLRPETIVDSYDNIVNVTPIVEEEPPSKRGRSSASKSTKETSRSKSSKSKNQEEDEPVVESEEDEEHPIPSYNRRKYGNKKESKEEDGSAPPKRKFRKKAKKEEQDEEGEDEEEATPKRKSRKSKVKKEDEEEDEEDNVSVKSKKHKTTDTEKTEEDTTNSISHRTRSTNPIETVELLEVPRRKHRKIDVLPDDQPDIEFTEGYTTPSGITLLSLGTINPDPAFQTNNLIFPVGFKSKRMHASVMSVSEKIYYISEVLQTEENTPLFRVYPESNPEMVFEGTSASGAWKKLLYAISDFRVEHGMRESGKSISGPEQYGFANPIVKKMIERLDPEHTCSVYWNARIPQEDGVDDSSFEEPSESDFSFRFGASDNEVDEVDSDMTIQMSEEKGSDGLVDSESEDDPTESKGLDDTNSQSVPADATDADATDATDADATDTDAADAEVDADADADAKVDAATEKEEAGVEADSNLQMEIIPFKKFRMEKDSFLVVRCRPVEGGYEAEDSLIDNILQVPMPVKKQLKRAKKQDPEEKPKRSRQTKPVNQKKGKKQVKSTEQKPSTKKDPATRKKPGRKPKPKEEDSDSYIKKKLPRKSRIEYLEEGIYKNDISGTYRLEFEAVEKVENMRVRVRPLDSSIKSGSNAIGSLSRRIMQHVEFDMKYNEIGHLMQMLYTFRLFSSKQSRVDIVGVMDFLEKLTTSTIPEVQKEAMALLQLFDLRRNSRKRGRKPHFETMDESGSTYKLRKVEPPPPERTDYIYTTDPMTLPSEATSSEVFVSIPIKSWGIRYHTTESFIYVQSNNALYILRGNSIQTNPSPLYASYFLREKRFFEICQQIYKVYKEFQASGQDLQYDEIINTLWNNNTCDDILIVEEDLIVEYPTIIQEMKDLEKHARVPYNPYYFGTNDFTINLKFRYELWKENNENAAYPFAITEDLTVAELRSSLLRFDQYIVGSIAQGTLPPASDSLYPTVHPFQEEELTSKDWFLILEIWCFMRSYASILGIADETVIQLNKSTFLNKNLSSDFIQNAYHIFIRYLNNDLVKHDISLRRQMNNTNWFIDGIFTTKRNGIFCDINNFDSYIRGYFNPASFAIENLDDVKDRMQYILITLMRHPDCVGFLHPVDESKHDVPGYSEIIKTPMDFHTICRRFVSDWYFEEQKEEGTSRGKGIRGVIEDILLIYSNCRTYNGSDSSIYRYQVKMLSLTEELIRQWILPLDDSVGDLLSQRSLEHDDSDEEVAPRRSRTKTASSKEASIVMDTTNINSILDELKTTDINMLPSADQIRLLASLYKLVRWSMEIMNERENRKKTLQSLQQGYRSIANQLRELKVVYSRQEHNLRTNFINHIKSTPNLKNASAMQRVTYTPRDNSEFTQERDLAVFLKKRTQIVSDIVSKMKQTSKELIDMQKSVWNPTPLGVDRNQNEYYFFPMEVPARVWIYSPHTESWSYLWHPKEFTQLLKWIDNRGSDEQYLYSALLLVKNQILTALTANLEFPRITATRPVREKDDLVVQEVNGVDELFQTSDKYFGIPNLSQEKPVVLSRKSTALPAITNNVFNSMFTTSPNEDVTDLKSVIAAYDHTDFSLKEYCDLILRIEDCILATVDSTFIYSDWIITRIFWRQRIANCLTFGEANFYVSDLESNCVDFSVVDALTNSIEREQFLQQYEDSGKNTPRIPDVGETVIYYAQGHEDAKSSFIQSNVLSGIYQYDEPSQPRDCICKVQSISYYWGRGNPFLRISLKTLHSSVPSTFVRSYYACLEKDEFEINPDLSMDDDLSVIFNCTVWLETTNSDFVIPFDVYCTAFSNNLHVGDRFRMWFQGIESQVSSRKKGKSSRLEGSYLYGTVEAIEETEGALFPWECITAKWEANSVEAGTNRINPWECEIESKAQKEKIRETKVQPRGDIHRLTEEEFQESRKKVEEIVRTHRAENGEKFYRFLVRYWAERGMEVQKPIMSFQELDLGLFWDMMQAFGGYDNVVSTKGCWQTMFTLLPNYSITNTSGPTQLHRIYLKFMYQYEKELREEKGLSPIGEPRLPVATAPGRIGVPVTKNNDLVEEEEKRDIMMYDASPGVMYLSKTLKDLEGLRTYYQNKTKILTNSLLYKVGDIATASEIVENDEAFAHIVNGNINVLKKKNERISKFMANLKQILNYYLYDYLL